MLYGKRNNEWRDQLISSLNRYLGTNFNQEEMYWVYDQLGNAVNHKLTLRFIRSDFNLKIIYQEVKAEWLEELKSYKDLEEHGLLVRLPCKVGDMVYKITRFCSGGIRDCGYSYECSECPEYKPFIEYIEFKIPILKDIGKTVFLAREEAEKKLDEMK